MNPQPNRFFQLSLIFLVALNLVPHFNDHTVPTLAVGGLCLAWRLLYEFQKVPLPNMLTKIGMVMALTLLVYQNHGRILGLEPGSALLICAVSLKLIDHVGYRDAMVLLFLNFMLLLARFFESQSLGITIFASFDLIITTALLVQLHNRTRLKFDVVTLLKTGTRLLLQIAPVMVLLFFIFPRLSGKYIRTQKPSAPVGGFSDILQPGNLSGVAGTDLVAFRVKFNGKAPSPLDLYWRGAVLSKNRGMTWSRGAEVKLNFDPTLTSKSPKVYQYEVLLEPYFKEWLFFLDRPLSMVHRNSNLNRYSWKKESATFILDKNQGKQFVYDAISLIDYWEESEAPQGEVYTQKHTESDPRVLRLVEKINDGAPRAEVKAHRLMKFYQKQFRYTLEPGPMETNTLGEFMFDKRVGFCEHFAVSFAALMRLADVPSRVVVGFQGGQKNSMNDYFIVTNKDAHAWTEIWSGEKNKWLRFDPTIMVSPLRLQLGGDLFHSLSDEQILGGDSQFLLSQWNNSWVNQASLAYDAVATSWNLFLINYDSQGQKSFFAKLGFKDVNQNLLLSVSLLVLLSFFLWVRLKNNKKSHVESRAQIAYMQLRKKLSKKGIEKEQSEGPSDFLLRCQKALPEQAESIENFRKAYLESEYGQEKFPIQFWKQSAL